MINSDFLWKVIEILVVPEYALNYSKLSVFLDNRVQLMNTIHNSKTISNYQIQNDDKELFLWTEFYTKSSTHIVQHQTSFCCKCGNYKEYVTVFYKFDFTKIECSCIDTRICNSLINTISKQIITNQKNSYYLLKLQMQKHTFVTESIKMYFSNIQLGFSNNHLTMSVTGICCICTKWNRLILTVCKHKFCNNCITRWTKINNTCPMCRHLL